MTLKSDQTKPVVLQPGLGKKTKPYVLQQLREMLVNELLCSHILSFRKLFWSMILKQKPSIFSFLISKSTRLVRSLFSRVMVMNLVDVSLLNVSSRRNCLFIDNNRGC